MKNFQAVFVCAVAVAVFASSAALASAQESKPTASQEVKAGREYSGMYSFLKDGEFVQISVEDEGRVTGFISRYGDGESDKGVFLDQFFRSGKLDGNKLNFITETVHAVWFEFRGTVVRGEGKNPGDEAYYVLKGSLADNSSDAAKKVTTHFSEVVFKMFPAEASPKN